MDINTLNRWLAVKAASVEGIPAVSLTTVGDAYVVDAGHHLVIIEVYHETVDKCRCKLLARYLETVDIKCFDSEQIKKTSISSAMNTSDSSTSSSNTTIISSSTLASPTRKKTQKSCLS